MARARAHPGRLGSHRDSSFEAGMRRALLWYVIAVLLTVRAVAYVDQVSWMVTLTTVVGALLAVGLAALRTPIGPPPSAP